MEIKLFLLLLAIRPLTADYCDCPTDSQELDSDVVTAFASSAFDLFAQTNTNLGSGQCMVKLRYTGHVTAYDSRARNPTWSAYILEPSQQKCNDGFRHGWRTDPTLRACSIDATTTGGSGDVWGDQDNGDSWDRGHVVPSYATSWNIAANSKTYYISNAAPQAATFNQQGWRIFEEHLSDYSLAQNTTLWVVVGVAYGITRLAYNRRKSV